MAPYDPEAKYEEKQGQSLFGVIIHSFFVVPFLIAVFCVLLFAAVRLLTFEKSTVFDYLEDVKAGAASKRWQSAFELSKLLANPDLIPKEERFVAEMLKVFEHSRYDDDRVRQYLALAMGRTGNRQFVPPLVAALKDEKEDNLYALIYSLGLFRDPDSASALYPFLDHSNPRVRLAAAMALGNSGEPQAAGKLQAALNDPEANVQWDAAIALAKLGSASGKGVLLELLDRSYLNKFPEVDPEEQNHVLLVALQAAASLKDPDIDRRIKELAQQDQNLKIRRAAMDLLPRH